MSDTPERIWVDDERPEGGGVHVWADLSEHARQWAVEYIRADLVEAKDDRIAELERQLADEQRSHTATLARLAGAVAREIDMQRKIAEAH